MDDTAQAGQVTASRMDLPPLNDILQQVDSAKNSAQANQQSVFDTMLGQKLPPAAGLDIGHAIVLMKAGHAVTRIGWNGRGMFVYFVDANAYPAQSPVAKRAFGPDAKVPYRSYLAMKTVDNVVVPWVASQTDLLANDWQIVEGMPDA